MIRLLLIVFMSISFMLMSISDNDKTLIKATRDNNISNVSKLLKDNKIDKLAKDDINKFSALTFASIFGYTDIAKLLIDNGFDVNSVDNVGWTPIMWASYYGNYDIVKMLIERGADVNRFDVNNNSALLLSTYFGYEDIMRLLLDYIPKIKNYPKFEYTYIADFANGCKMIKILHDEYGASLPIKSYEQLFVAMQSKQYDCVKYLIENGADANAYIKWTYTRLFDIPIIQQNFDMVKYLLDHNADPIYIIELHAVSIETAVLTGNFEMLKLMLEYKKENIDRLKEWLKTTDDFPKLRYNNKQIYNYFIEKGIDSYFMYDESIKEEYLPEYILDIERSALDNINMGKYRPFLGYDSGDKIDFDKFTKEFKKQHDNNYNIEFIGDGVYNRRDFYEIRKIVKFLIENEIPISTRKIIFYEY